MHHLNVHGEEWGGFGMGLTAVLLFFIFGGLAIARKNETRFYLAMAVISILQPVLFLHIGDMNR
jgi:cell division protein FtsW (lipid II flippase)